MLAYTAADNMATENNNAAADPSTTAKRFSSTNHGLQQHLLDPMQSLRSEGLKRIKNEWITYLLGSDPDSSHLSQSHLCRLALAEHMYRLEQDEHRILFHLTLTYKPYKDRVYRESDVNVFFIRFWIRHFLPHLLNTKNIHTNSKKLLQPICLAFVDEHEMKPVKYLEPDPNVYRFVQVPHFPARLHHHAILAAHPEHLDLMKELIGRNTFTQFSKKVMTSDLKRCEPMRLLYASKMYRKYPDYLSFPDRFHRQHRRIAPSAIKAQILKRLNKCEVVN